MEIFSISNLIILSVTLIVIIFYTVETYKLRKINASQLKLNLELQEPDVIAYFDTGKIHGQLLFIVENVGRSSAYNIKAKFDRDFDPVSEIIKKNFTINPLFSDKISVLPAHKHLEYDAGMTPNIYLNYGTNSDAYKYKLKIIFDNYVKKPFEKEYSLDIQHIITRVSLSKKTLIEEYLDGINDSLKKLTTNNSNN